MGIVSTLVIDDELVQVAKRLGVKPRQNPAWMVSDFPGMSSEGYHWRDLVVALAARVEELEARLDEGSG